MGKLGEKLISFYIQDLVLGGLLPVASVEKAGLMSERLAPMVFDLAGNSVKFTFEIYNTISCIIQVYFNGTTAIGLVNLNSYAKHCSGCAYIGGDNIVIGYIDNTLYLKGFPANARCIIYPIAYRSGLRCESVNDYTLNGLVEISKVKM